jgi:hypothetical protein
MFTVVADAKQLRDALREIENSEENGFNCCLAIFNLKEYGTDLCDCKIEFEGLIEKAHPTERGLNWGRGQSITKRKRFEDGKLIPL